MTDFQDDLQPLIDLGYTVEESVVGEATTESGIETPAPPPDVQIYRIEGPDFRSYVAEGDTDLAQAYAQSLPDTEA